MPKSRTELRGFSLVELLVVIGIISVLIAILLPALQKAKLSAMSVMCMSNQRQIALGIHQYATEYRGAMLHMSDGDPLWYPSGTGPLGAEAHRGGWVLRLRLSGCVKDGGPSSLPEPRDAQGIFACPLARSHEWFSTYRSDFGLNAVISTTSWFVDGEPRLRYVGQFSRLRLASRVFLLGDSYIPGFLLASPPELRTTHSIFPTVVDSTLHKRHNGAANVVFADGHGEGVRSWPTNLTDPYWGTQTIEWRGY